MSLLFGEGRSHEETSLLSAWAPEFRLLLPYNPNVCGHFWKGTCSSLGWIWVRGAPGTLRNTAVLVEQSAPSEELLLPAEALATSASVFPCCNRKETSLPGVRARFILVCEELRALIRLQQ